MKLNDINKMTKLTEITGSTGNIYSIYEEPDKSLYCDCPARKKDCKHIKEYNFKISIERALTQLEFRGFITVQSPGAFQNIVNWICRLRKESL